MSSNLEIDVTTGPDVITVVMRGEFDADNCAELTSRVPVEPSADIAIDMSDVRFIDSSGISEILRLRERVTATGGSLSLPAVSPQVRKVLEITGLVELLGVGST